MSRLRKIGWGAGLTALLLALAFAAASCGGNSSSSGDSSGGGDTITVNWGTEPPSLDPGLATDVTSSNILLNIMDPLVRLDDDLNPVASAAESFETSEVGRPSAMM